MRIVSFSSTSPIFSEGSHSFLNAVDRRIIGVALALFSLMALAYFLICRKPQQIVQKKDQDEKPNTDELVKSPAGAKKETILVEATPEQSEDLDTPELEKTADAKQPAATHYTLNVRGLAGEHFQIDVDATEDIENVKKKVQKNLDVHRPVKLIYAGRQLAEGSKLSDYPIRSDHTIHFVYILQPATDEPKKAEETKTTEEPKPTVVPALTWTMTVMDNGGFLKAYSNGIVETGVFENDQLKGNGIRVYPKPGIQPHLDGDPEITSLKGEFDEGKFIEGEVLYFDERKFTGTMRDGQLGSGKMDYSKVKSSQFLYVDGPFENNKPHGYVEFCYQEGKPQHKYFYQGTLRDINLSNGYPVIIKTLTGRTLTINLEAIETIFDLKCKIQMVEGLPIDQLRLVFNGRQLDDDKTRSDYNIPRDARVTCILKLRGD